MTMRILCPLDSCAWAYDVEDKPSWGEYTSLSLAGLQGAMTTLAMADSAAIEAKIREHLETEHVVLDYLKMICRLQGQIKDLNLERNDLRTRLGNAEYRLKKYEERQ